MSAEVEKLTMAARADTGHDMKLIDVQRDLRAVRSTARKYEMPMCRY